MSIRRTAAMPLVAAALVTASLAVPASSALAHDAQDEHDAQPGDVGIWYATWFSRVDVPEATWLTGFGGTSTAQFAADVDGDGRADAIAFEGGTWQVARSDGERFTAPQSWASAAGEDSTYQLVSDVDGDGKADAISYHAGDADGDGHPGDWYVALSTGTSFAPESLWASGLGGPSAVALSADVDGDGVGDAIAVDAATGRWTVGIASGRGFASGAQWATDLASGMDDYFVADVDGDGAADAAGYSEGTWVVGHSTGAAFAPQEPYSAGHGSGSTFRFLTDGNNDGYAEPYAFFDADLALPTPDGAVGDLVAREYDRTRRALDGGNLVVNSGVGESVTNVFMAATSGDEYGWQDVIGFDAAADGGTWTLQRYRQADSVSWNTWAGFPGKLPIAYQPRTLGQYRQYDSGDADVIDEHIEMITAAQMDYLLLDETNNLNNVSGAILNRARRVAERLDVWNDAPGNPQLQYAFAIGGIQWSNDPVTIEQEARQTWEEFASDPQIGDDYYTVDGKPLLVVYTNKANQAAWRDYTGDKSATDRFTVRFASSDPHATEGEYGWQLPPSGTVHDDSLMLAMPGWNNHIDGYVPVARDRGTYYTQKVWDVILDRESMPDGIIINSFNEFAEDTALQPTDTSGLDSTSEKWENPDGELDPDMYWNLTVDYVAQYKQLASGDPAVINVTGPQINGTPDVGETLTAESGRWRSAGPADSELEFSYQWSRNGRPITGATGDTYPVRAGDQGKRLAVSVTGSRAGATATAASAEQTVRTRTATVAWATPSLPRAGEPLTVDVRVLGLGGATPTGDVVVEVEDVALKGTLRNGTAKIEIPALPRGIHTLPVAYGGDETSSPSSTSVLVLVHGSAGAPG